MVFFAMKLGIDVTKIKPYQLQLLDGDESFHRYWTTNLAPDVKPSDWIFV